MSERPSQTKQILDAVKELSVQMNALSAQVTETRIKVASIEEKISYQPRIDAQRFENLEKNEVTCKQTFDHKLSEIKGEVGEVKEEVADIKSKPAKRWELIVVGLITAAVMAFVDKILKW